MAEQKIKHIVRVANTDLAGHKKLCVALTKIRGVSVMFANMMCKMAGVNTEMKAGLLNSNQIEKLDKVLSNPDKHNVPAWMRNRRKDYITGKDNHLITGDLQFIQKQDVRRLQKIRSYRGLRHSRGLPLRGQRTKGNFRKNKGKAVGVKRKSGIKSGRV
jgi:small subunit ribosomal protein S13